MPLSVDHPEDVVVTETETDKALVVELKVAQEDMGKVIGKQGRMNRRFTVSVGCAPLLSHFFASSSFTEKADGSFVGS